MCPGDYGGQLGMTNEVVGEMYKYEKEGSKAHFVRKISINEFWKCIGGIISEVNHGKKGFRIWGKTHDSEHGMVICQM